MKLLNVRLSADDARRAAALRKAGVQLSRVVREAIRVEYDRRVTRTTGRRSAAAILAEIYAAHPDPPGVRRRGFDLRDRKAVREAVLTKLRRKRG